MQFVGKTPLEDDEEEENPDDVYIVEQEIELDENDVNEGLDDDMEDLDLDVDEENGYIPDDAIMAFLKHQGSVFCVGINPINKKMAVSGGEDDKAFVWNTETGDVLFELGGHNDSVVSCGFSYDGKFVMSADMGGVIVVHNVDEAKSVWDFKCSDIEWAKWHPSAYVLFAGTTDGDLYMLKMPSGECKICNGHGSKCTAGELLPNGRQLVAGYEDGSIKLWDLKSTSVLFHITGDSSVPVSCVACHKNGSLMASAFLNGTTKLIISSNGKVVGTLLDSSGPAPTASQASESQELRSIEALAFSPDQQYVACGGLNGSLVVWDIPSQRVRHRCPHPHGISRVIWHESNPTSILTGCLDGAVRSWDSRSGSLEKEWKGHREDVLDVCLSSDGELLLTGSDDKSARVFRR